MRTARAVFRLFSSEADATAFCERWNRRHRRSGEKAEHIQVDNAGKLFIAWHPIRKGLFCRKKWK